MKQYVIFIVIVALFVQCYINTLTPSNSEKSKNPEERVREILLKKKADIEISAEERNALTFKNEKTVEKTIEKTKNVSNASSNIIHIPINNPIPLSYKTKKQVYQIRKSYVRNSIFANPNYEPSESVFGQIVDNKPWVSMKLCKYDATGKADIEGPSEETRFINNPALLIAPEYAFYGHSCEDKALGKGGNRKEVPISITYDKNENEITVTYKHLVYCIPKGWNAWFSLKGLNARDLGYKYVYIDKEKSTFNFYFKEKVNASNTVVELRDFIHLGGSCSHESGCNNGSPNQPPLNIVYPCVGENGKSVKDKIIYIKLWKEKPSSPQQKADIVEKLVIQKSWVE